jgi:toxin CcdB
VLDVQSAFLSERDTRLVVPLMAPPHAPVPGRRLNPAFEIEGRALVMATQYLSAPPTHSLGKQVTDLSARRGEIVSVPDVILRGF